MAIKKATDVLQSTAETMASETTASAQAIESAVKTVGGEAVNVAAEAMDRSVSAAAAFASATGFDKAPAEIKANMEKAMKTAEDFVTFGQGNLEAFVKAGQIWAAGVQDLSKQVAANAQAQVEQTVATFKALAGVKSLKEAVDLQTSLARASMEKAMAETGKLTDASLKLTEQAMAPLTARMTLAVEKFGRPV
jgi:phasin family protein